ncbi:hypothetical protein B0H14DRAFT_3013633 [Mycena olivaceomarginata]|nr:hypothetical protein B0H14DRAFT_3013633 [Mycena olivaceomarginata]
MRQAYASKTIAQWLPTETLIEISRLFQTQTTFSRPLSACHKPVVVLRDYDRAKTFLEGMLANPSRAGAIRSFTVTDRACILHRPHQDWKKTMRSFADLLINLVKLMVPQLEHLSICPDLLATDHGIDLQLCHISSHTATRTCTLAADALDGEARLYWSGREDIERTVVALRSMTGPDIPFVSINNGTETDQCTALVEALATHIPNIKTLNMWAATDWPFFFVNVCSGFAGPYYNDHLMAYLPHFKGLMYLALEDALSYRDVDEESYSVRDKMHAVVVNWAGICPTLEACCLHRYGTWDFCTQQVFRNLTNALWYFR